MGSEDNVRISVLVVDDNPAGLYLTSKMLRMENFDVIEASSGQEAMSKIKDKPDVVILDVKLPDISGFEVCRKIKADPASSNIPVIHLTATYLDADSKAFGLDSGADAYLTHPVEPKVLIASINAVLRIRQAEAKLGILNLQLERSNKELEQFAYAASHDLQEPLRMISSFTKLLSKKIELINDEKTKEYFDVILDASTRMQRLISDLLGYSRLTTGATVFEKVEMEKVVKNVLTDLKMVIDESKAKITWDPLPTVKGDNTQLSRLMQNLISNAIKFRGEKDPVIHIGVKKEPSGQWTFCISDNGIGIEREYFERIFVIFQRLHERREYEGTGIGLALCKKIVERHGGRIWLESTPGKGSIFFFTIAT